MEWQNIVFLSLFTCLPFTVHEKRILFEDVVCAWFQKLLLVGESGELSNQDFVDDRRITHQKNGLQELVHAHERLLLELTVNEIQSASIKK